MSDLRRRCGIEYCLTLLRIAIAFYSGMHYAVLVPRYPTLNVNGTTVKFYDWLLRFCIQQKELLVPTRHTDTLQKIFWLPTVENQKNILERSILKEIGKNGQEAGIGQGDK